MGYNACITELKEASGLTDDQLEEMIDLIVKKKRQLKGQAPLKGDEEVLTQAVEELTEAEKVAAAQEKRRRMINAKAKIARFEKYGDSREDRILRRLSVGDESGDVAAGRSVDAEAHAMQYGLAGGMVGELRQAGLLAYATAPTDDIELRIAEELRRLGDPTSKASGDPMAERAAAIIGKYQEMARVMQNEAGASIAKRPDWIVRQSHDPHKIGHASIDAGFLGTRRLARMGRGNQDIDRLAWISYIKPLLRDDTYGNADPDKFLADVWKNLVAGNHLKSHGGEDWLGGFKGPGNLAKRISRERVLHFKSAQDWLTYHRRFGRGTLMEAVVGGLETAARNTAVMRVWGTNPEAAFNADRRQLIDRAHKRGDLKTEKKLNAQRQEWFFKNATGLVNVPGNPDMALFGAGLRAWQSMKSLGGVVLSSLPDLASRAATLRHHGVGMFDAYANGLESLVRGRDKGWVRAFADNLGIGIDGILGHVFAQINSSDGTPGVLSGLTNLFFKYNLSNWWNDSLKTGFARKLSVNLARHADKSWSDLGDDLRRSLGRYDIDAGKWDEIRTAGLKQADTGEHYITAEGMSGETGLALRTYFVDTVHEGMNIGGARTSSLINFGYQAGTPAGEAARLIMQFKSFPISFATRQLARELSRKGRPDIPGFVRLIGMTTILGYVSLAAKDLAKGRSPRDPRDPATMVAAMQQGGGLGIYGDFLFGQYNRFGGGGIETLMGPTLTTAGEALRIFGAAREGEGSATAAVRFATNQLPFINLFYTRLALDYLVLWQIQEAMNPGWAARFEKRMKRDHGQEFILGPTDAVR